MKTKLYLQESMVTCNSQPQAISPYMLLLSHSCRETWIPKDLFSKIDFRCGSVASVKLINFLAPLG